MKYKLDRGNRALVRRHFKDDMPDLCTIIDLWCVPIEVVEAILENTMNDNLEDDEKYTDSCFRQFNEFGDAPDPQEAFIVKRKIVEELISRARQ